MNDWIEALILAAVAVIIIVFYMVVVIPGLRPSPWQVAPPRPATIYLPAVELTESEPGAYEFTAVAPGTPGAFALAIQPYGTPPPAFEHQPPKSPNAFEFTFDFTLDDPDESLIDLITGRSTP